VFLEAESLQEVLQTLKVEKMIRDWNSAPYLDPSCEDREDEMWDDFEHASDSYNDAVEGLWHDYYYSEEFIDDTIDIFKEYDNYRNGLVDLPSDRELWILRQARKAAKLFGFGYWNTGMEKAWPKFVQKYHITTREADAFWIEYYNHL
jgi:hypothetical protein